MSELIFIVVIVILSPQDIDVIFNKVTVNEYRNSEIGWQSSKRIRNSKKDILALTKEVEMFKGENSASECYLNFAGKDAGWISQFMDVSQMPRELDVKEFSVANNIPTGYDEDIVRYCQEKILQKKIKKKKK